MAACRGKEGWRAAVGCRHKGVCPPCEQDVHATGATEKGGSGKGSGSFDGVPPGARVSKITVRESGHTEGGVGGVIVFAHVLEGTMLDKIVARSLSTRDQNRVPLAAMLRFGVELDGVSVKAFVGPG